MTSGEPVYLEQRFLRSKLLACTEPTCRRSKPGARNITIGTLYRIADHFGIAASRLLPD